MSFDSTQLNENIASFTNNSESFYSNQTHFSEKLSSMRKKNINRVIIAHININSIRYKFDLLVDGIKGNIDILMISETKIDASFPTRQFSIEGFSSPYRLDRDGYGGGILVYVREDIPSKLIPIKDSAIEGFFLEINMRKKKWLMCFSYNPSMNQISKHIESIGKTLDVISSKHDNILLIGDYNADISNNFLKDFCDLYNLKNLIKVPTCYKNPDKPSSIDVMLTNVHRSFCNSCSIETGLSDFHKMTISILKTDLKKKKPKIITYRDYKNFDNDKYQNLVSKELANIGSNRVPASLSPFMNVCYKALDQCAPKKKKYIRANNSPFVNKSIKKAIMNRTRLRNKYFKHKTFENKLAYTKQRNYCLSLIRKAKTEYFGNLDEKTVKDNKLFWKSVCPLFSEKSVNSSKISLFENKLIQNDQDIANIFNNYFSTVVLNLNIPQYKDSSVQVEQINDPILKIIEKFKNHPSIVSIQNQNWEMNKFSFQAIEKADIRKEILNMNCSKASQESDIPTKIIKMNVELFSDFLFRGLNKSLQICEFPSCMKLADVTPVFKKGNHLMKENYRPVSILTNISKVFERCVHKQLSCFFDNI